MATIRNVGKWLAPGVHQTVWEGITSSGDTIQAETAGGLADKTVHAKGTFGSATVTIKGSQSATATDLVTLHTTTGGDLTFTSGGMRVIRENTYRIKPTISGTTTDTDVDVLLISVEG